MAKFFSALIALVALNSIFGTSFAHADDMNEARRVTGPYTCTLAGQMHGESIAIIIGGQEISGNGVIRCTNPATGRVVRTPVALRMSGVGVGVDFTVIKSMRVFTAGIEVADPRQFVGSFGLGATAGASIIRAGLAFDAAVEVSGRGGLSFDLGLAGENVVGLGAHLYGMTFEVARR